MTLVVRIERVKEGDNVDEAPSGCSGTLYFGREPGCFSHIATLNVERDVRIIPVLCATIKLFSRPKYTLR